MRKRIDENYIIGMKQGDEDSIEYVFEFYKNQIFHLALSVTKNESDADEVIQTTFIQAINKLDTLQNIGSFHSWILSIAYNNALIIIRKNKKYSQPFDDEPLENMLESKISTQTEYEKKEFIQIIHLEIDKLPVTMQEIARLRFFSDLTTKEISGALEMPEGTVKTQLSRIRKIMKTVLADNGYRKFTAIAIVFLAYRSLLPTKTYAAEKISKPDFSSVQKKPSSNNQKTTTTKNSRIRLSKSSLVFLSAAAVTCTIAFAIRYNANDNQTKVSAIETIMYEDKVTANSIEVYVEATELTDDNFSVSYNKEKIEAQRHKNGIRFVAEKNGTYSIQIGNEHKEIEIDNIDKSEPDLKLKYTDGILQLFPQDELAGIDYDKCYLEYNNQKISIPKSGLIEIHLDGMATIYIFDNVGNSAEFVYQPGE